MIIKNVFPFDLFPDKIVIDEEAVNIVYSEFFGSEEVESVLISGIASFEVQSNPLFATIKIIDKDFQNKIIKIKYLLKDEALRAQRLVYGLIAVKEKKIDISNIPSERLVHEIEELGKIYG